MSNGVSERGFCCCYSKLLSLGLSKLKGCWAKLLLGWWWESGTGSDVPGDCLYCSTAEEHLLQEVTVWILVRKPAIDKNNLFICCSAQFLCLVVPVAQQVSDFLH